MRTYQQEYRGFYAAKVPRRLRTWRVRQKLLVALIPPIICIIILTGYLTYWFSNEFLNEAIERIVRIQSVGIAHGVEDFLNQCREDLLLLAEGSITRESLLRFQESRIRVRGYAYREVGFVSNKGKEHIFLSAGAADSAVFSEVEPSTVYPNPLLLMEKVSQLNRNDVWISGISEAIHASPRNDQMNPMPTARTLRLTAPYFAEDNSFAGFLLLAVDLSQVRDILTLYNSQRSPIFAFVRSPEVRYSFFFDTEGWILFQSEEVEAKNRELSTDKVRASFSGRLGAPGFPIAFRPDYQYGRYWQMLENVRNGKHGVLRMKTRANLQSWTDHYFLGYAPVRFTVGQHHEPLLLGGIAFADRSRLAVWAGYRQIDVMFVITLATITIIVLLIFGLGRMITRPILELATAVNQIEESGGLQEIRLEDRDQETSFLKNAINRMIDTLTTQMEEIRIKDELIWAESQREKARLEEEVNALRQRLQSQEIGEIVGVGPVIDTLKSEILKAASVDVDVLITGETGTGKQLTAEAIHRHSSRGTKPFISINCGALDENLLLDSLFGHVKGAFTEAKTDRKGAFLAAHGGTLFLDEIGAASPKVQQALLRAIAMREIRPLGSDKDIEVDVRLIAASNVDLRELIEKGLFREDLYYRLAVIIIQTPALRDHSENIPIFVEHFFKEASRLMKRTDLGFSRAALEKLKNHHWPGNIRELKNCITRAVAMAEGNLIHSEDIKLGDKDTVRPVERYPAERVSTVYLFQEQNQLVRDREEAVQLFELNARQKKALSFILEKGEITRSEYQQVVGNNLPARTALYDLQDLVRRGLLRKTGRGPATRYYLAKLPDFAR